MRFRIKKKLHARLMLLMKPSSIHRVIAGALLVAAGGLVAIAEPVSGAVGAGPPGAVSITVSVPLRVVEGSTELGLKTT